MLMPSRLKTKPGIVSVVQQRVISISGRVPKEKCWADGVQLRHGARRHRLSRAPRAHSVIEPGTTHTLKYIIRTQLFVITFLVLHYSQRRLLCVHSPSRRGRRQNTRGVSAAWIKTCIYKVASPASWEMHIYKLRGVGTESFNFSAPVPSNRSRNFCNSRSITNSMRSDSGVGAFQR